MQMEGKVAVLVDQWDANDGIKYKYKCTNGAEDKEEYYLVLYEYTTKVKTTLYLGFRSTRAHWTFEMDYIRARDRVKLLESHGFKVVENGAA